MDGGPTQIDLFMKTCWAYINIDADSLLVAAVSIHHIQQLVITI